MKVKSNHADVQQQHTLTARESTKITRFGVNATYEMLKRGQMPGISVGKKWFIPRSRPAALAGAGRQQRAACRIRDAAA